MTDKSFKCPYCNNFTTITEPNQFNHLLKLDLKESNFGCVGLFVFAITCPNPKCNKLFLKISLYKIFYRGGYWVPEKLLHQWQLLPESEARVLPDYIPKPIQQDYYEACRIRDLSPKASATLSRRCLQGMIRDFWGIKKSRLIDEIKELENKIDASTWAAIDSVREVSNIGAHMEKDINIIVDVDPKEAQLLIGLVETLVDDWYVDKHNKEERLENIKKLATVKKQQKTESVKK